MKHCNFSRLVHGLPVLFDRWLGEALSEKKPLVSVLMCCYREPEYYLKLAIDSILNQTYENIEIMLVVDDPDNEMIRQIVHGYSLNDDRIVPIFNERNLGLTSSLNRAIHRAKGEYLCRMDSDDISDSTRVEKQLSHLLDNDLDLVGSFLNVIGENNELLYQVTNIPTQSRSIKKALRYNNCVPHPSWLGRAAVFEGGYREIPYAEDYDFLIRAILRGFKIGNVPERLVSYRMSLDSISRSNMYKQYLTQKYLSVFYSRGKWADINELSRFVALKYDSNKDKRYSEANRRFNSGMSLLRRGISASALKDIAAVPFLSISYFAKLIRMIRASIC